MLLVPPSLRTRIAKGAVRLSVAVLILTAPLWGTSSTYDTSGYSGQLNRVIRGNSFSLAEWEVSAVASQLWEGAGAPFRESSQPLPPYDSDEAIALVYRYFSLGRDQRRLQGEIDLSWVQRDDPERANRLVAVREQMNALAHERNTMESAVERIVAEQLARELEYEGFSRDIVRVDRRPGTFPLAVDVTPSVWFRLTSLPRVLVVAPRTAVSIESSYLVRSELDLSQIEDLEDRVDMLGVSSVVTPIGGLAAYPSMVPGDQGLAPSLTTIAHEWVHQYFFVRPLGIRYFSSYRMRSINETAADIAGIELGRKVYQRYYAEIDTSPPARRVTELTTGQPSFGEIIRSTRREVERLLEKGDLIAAERHMQDQKAVLAQHGYYVRKLNTAYLSLFGSYAGTGNPDEPYLRLLRERSGSLKAFLDAVGAVDSIEAFDRPVER